MAKAKKQGATFSGWINTHVPKGTPRTAHATNIHTHTPSATRRNEVYCTVFSVFCFLLTVHQHTRIAMLIRSPGSTVQRFNVLRALVRAVLLVRTDVRVLGRGYRGKLPHCFWLFRSRVCWLRRVSL